MIICLRGRKPGEDDSKQLPTPPGLLQEQLVWVCVCSAETQPCHSCWFPWAMAGAAGVWNLRARMRTALHPSTTHCQTLEPEHRSLVGINTPVQTGKNSSTKKLNSLWTGLCCSTVSWTQLSYPCSRKWKMVFLYSEVLQMETSACKCWSFLACYNNQWEPHCQYRSQLLGKIYKPKNISSLRAMKITWKKYDTCLLFSLVQCSLLRDTKCLIFLATEIICYHIKV